MVVHFTPQKWLQDRRFIMRIRKVHKIWDPNICS
uniref:Uncharacterized protein n=1 Tax=Anguilla anguilla TaxID=7936 RepID=A0A0E9SCZ6_ANGAN